MADKQCSVCKKLNPLNSHRCFVFGKGRLINIKPDKNSISEKLYDRIKKEFPEYLSDMNSDIRPERIYRRASYNWSYWPTAGFCVGSAWTMKECVKAKEWHIFIEGLEFTIYLIKQE